jgi:hypothetical protein
MKNFFRYKDNVLLFYEIIANNIIKDEILIYTFI